MDSIILYSRHECPLCEDIEETLNRLKIKFKFTDIDADVDLKKIYHARVPVLFNAHKNQEIQWPFEDRRLIEFAS